MEELQKIRETSARRIKNKTMTINVENMTQNKTRQTRGRINITDPNCPPVGTAPNLTSPRHALSCFRSNFGGDPSWPTEDIRVAFANARSVNNKVEPLVSMIKNLKPCVVALCETWERQSRSFRSKITNLCDRLGYNWDGWFRTNRRGGGVAILTRNRTIDILEIETAEAAGNAMIQLKASHTSGQKIRIVGAYLVPSSSQTTMNKQAMIDTLYGWLDSPEVFDVTLVGGDWNKQTPDLSQHGLSKFTEPTRGDQALDEVWYTGGFEGRTHNPLGTGTDHESDHRVVFLRRKNPKKQNSIQITRRQITENAMAEIKSDMAAFVESGDWDKEMNVDRLDELIQTKMWTSLDKHAPPITRSFRPGNLRCLSEDCLKLLEERDKEHDHNGETDRFRKLRARARRSVRKCKRLYCKDKAVNMIKSNPQGWFREVKKMSELRFRDNAQDGFESVEELKEKNDEEQIEIMKKHFAKTGTQYPSDLPEQLPDEAWVIPRRTVLKAIKHTKATKGTHPSDMPWKVIQHCREELATLWTRLFNLISFYKTIPESWKEEAVSVIPKCPSPPNLSKLRNISILPMRNKVFERIVNDVILGHLELPIHQFGFQPECSIQDCIITLRHRVLKHLDASRDNVALILSLDIKSAFPSIKYSAIIRGLQHAGVPNRVINIMMSYLRNRRMTIRHKGLCSGSVTLTNGAPQGSIVSPGLFSAAFSLIDLSRFRTEAIQFADDSSLTFMTSRSELAGMIKDGVVDLDGSDLGRAMRSFRDQAADMGLVVHPGKTRLICVDGGRRVPPLRLSLDGIKVKEVDSLELLGFDIVKDFSPSEYIRGRFEKARRRSWIISKLRKFVPSPDILQQAYNTFVRSSMETYLQLAWPVNAVDLEYAEITQRKCKRIAACGMNPENAFRKDWKPLKKRWEEQFEKFAVGSLFRLKPQQWWAPIELDNWSRRKPFIFGLPRRISDRFADSTIPNLLHHFNKMVKSNDVWQQQTIIRAITNPVFGGKNPLEKNQFANWRNWITTWFADEDPSEICRLAWSVFSSDNDARFPSTADPNFRAAWDPGGPGANEDQPSAMAANHPTPVAGVDAEDVAGANTLEYGSILVEDDMRTWETERLIDNILEVGQELL